MDRRTFLAGAGVAAAASLAGCLTAGSERGDWDVGMTMKSFDPPAVEVSVGEPVVWRNTSGNGHTVTAIGDSLPEGATYFASGGFDSEEAAVEGWQNGLAGRIDAGEEYTHTFEVAGEYEYYCIPHEPGGMYGTLTVTE